MKFAVSICATKAYTHAMMMQARRVQQCVAMTDSLRGCEGYIILSGDNSDELRAVERMYAGLMPLEDKEKGIPGWKVINIPSVKADAAAERPHKGSDGNVDTERGKKAESARKAKAFRRIADMREAAHSFALREGVDFVWSLDSDVIPPVNALRSSFDALAFDGGYYSVAFCPYPNLLWLGGLGEPGRPMAEDFLPLERKLSRRLRYCLETCEQRLKVRPSRKETLRKTRLEARARTKPSDGNIWEVTAKYGWRRRGWLDHYAPGIGKGAVLPCDWVGYGCTLMPRKALLLSDFIGFQGQGTEDVFVIANRWEPQGIKMCVLPHCPCDHFYYERKDGKNLLWYLRAYHEPSGEYRGHLRFERRPWNNNPAEMETPADAST